MSKFKIGDEVMIINCEEAIEHKGKILKVQLGEYDNLGKRMILTNLGEFDIENLMKV